MKKLVCVLLTALLLLGSVGVMDGGAASAAVPSVYILGGNGAVINAEGEEVLPIETSDGYLSEAITDCIGDLAKALVLRTDEAKAAYKDKLVSWLAPLYEKVVMDNNGDPIGEYAPVYWNGTPFVVPEVAPNYISNGVYAVDAYTFRYDWRLDPFVNAALLNDYIAAILRGTGAQKVNLLGRCEGATIAMAYLAEYGNEKVNKIFFNTSAAQGYLLTTSLFSGELDFSSRNIKSYFNNNPNVSMDDLDLSEMPMGAELFEMLTALLDGGAALPALDIPSFLLDAIYADLLREIIPEILRVSYGTFPAAWAMVDSDYFDEAVEYVFGGHEEEYSGLIERITRYHEEVALQTEALLADCMEKGIAVGGITKYGYPAVPLMEESDQLSDGHALVKRVSFGATASKHTGTLDEKYINRRVSDGLGKYISPDHKIDASTCLFPDTMWFVGNLEHQNFPWMIDDLTQRFFLTDGMTVETDAAYPQFMLYVDENNSFVPLTEENADLSVVGGAEEEESVVNAFDRFMSGFLSIVLRIVIYVRGIIAGIVEHAEA